MSYFSLTVTMHIKYCLARTWRILREENLERKEEEEMLVPDLMGFCWCVLENSLMAAFSWVSNAAFPNLYSVGHQSQEILQNNVVL